MQQRPINLKNSLKKINLLIVFLFFESDLFSEFCPTMLPILFPNKLLLRLFSRLEDFFFGDSNNEEAFG